MRTQAIAIVFSALLLSGCATSAPATHTITTTLNDAGGISWEYTGDMKSNGKADSNNVNDWSLYTTTALVPKTEAGLPLFPPESTPAFHATTGFINDIAIVSLQSASSGMALMNKSGHWLTQFGEYTFPTVRIIEKFPASIVAQDTDKPECTVTCALKFPFWKLRSDYNSTGFKEDFFVENLLLAEQNGYYGFLDRKGNVVIPFANLAANEFKEGKARAFHQTEGFGFYTPDGQFTPDDVRCQAVINGVGHLISHAHIPQNPKFDIRFGEPIYYSYKFVENDKQDACRGNVGIVDFEGKTLLPESYELIVYDTDFQQFITMNENNEYELFNASGKKITKAKYGGIVPTIDERYKYIIQYEGNNRNYNQSGTVGLLDISRPDKPAIPIKYKAIQMGEYFIAAIEGAGKITVYNRKGQLLDDKIQDIVYMSANPPKSYPFSSEYIVSQYLTVRKDNKWGLMDATGKYILAPTYELLSEVQDNYIRFKQGNTWGVMDVKGKIIAQPIYASIEPFIDSRAEARLPSGAITYIYTSQHAKEAWLERSRLDELRKAAESRAYQEQLARQALEDTERANQRMVEIEQEKLSIVKGELMDYKRENDELKKENEKLKQEVDKLEHKVDQLEKKLQSQQTTH